MIEKVAIALAMSQNPGNWISDFNEDHRKLWRIRAKAAIQAMREPSEEMIKAGDNINESQCMGIWVAVEQIFEAMIDAALKE